MLFVGKSGGVKAICCSPDNQHLLTVGVDYQENTTAGAVRLWDISSGKLLRSFKGHSKLVTCAAFSPDGRYAITGGWDKIAILWDVVSGSEVRVFDAHTDWLSAVAFSNDGSKVLTGGYDRTLRLWDSSSGRELRKFNVEGIVNTLSCSRNGRFVFFGNTPHKRSDWLAYSNLLLLDLQNLKISSPPSWAFSKSPFESSYTALSPDGRFALFNTEEKARVRGEDVVTCYLTLRELPE